METKLIRISQQYKIKHNIKYNNLLEVKTNTIDVVALRLKETHA